MSAYNQGFVVTLKNGAIVKVVIFAEHGEGESRAARAAIELFGKPSRPEAPILWDCCAYPIPAGASPEVTLLSM
jgi:hypothetical protein